MYDRKNQRVITANIGDSRSIIAFENTFFATKDHKPGDEDEKARIELAGGKVLNCLGVWRINN